MPETVGAEARDEPVKVRRRRPQSVSGFGDKVYSVILTAAGLTVLAITGAVGLFLLLKASQALHIARFKFLTTQQWEPDVHKFGIAAAIPGTVMIALVAVIVATPISVGTALFISEIAPARAKRTLVSVVDLMAAVPSVVYGLWGFLYLQGHLIGVARWMATWLSWIPFFRIPGADPTNPLANNTVYSASAFIAGVVVGLMIAPIQCSVMREVFSQAPPGEREGAFALGSTRWGMIRTVVLPFGRGGMIGGTMLALGRALGETVAVYLIISLRYKFSLHILKSGSISVSALIATRYSDSSALGLSALFAAGLVLFLMTLLVNFIASLVVARSRSGALSET
jgi:phosphate transport system permease protein